HFSEGASTITQQLVKNNVLTSWTEEKDFFDKLERKIQEQYLAICLERDTYKAFILENYLNTINLGSGCWGVQAASMRYFNKDVSDLTLSECALLAGITKNPSAYSPLNDAEKCQSRQKLVLKNMYEQKYISKKAYKKALKDPVFDRVKENRKNADQNDVLSYFEDALLNQVCQDLMIELSCSEDAAWKMLYRGGLTIYSTQDSKLQKIAEEEINNDDYYSEDSQQSSIVVMDYRNGSVAAIVGGRGKKNASLVWNRATDSPRQPGSAIKVLGQYALALENGDITLGTVLDDEPYTYSDGKEVNNADGTFSGMITVRQAIVESLNIPAVKVLQQEGIKKVWKNLQILGFSHLGKEDKVESLALGGTYNGVTNLELTNAYGVIANGGILYQPKYYTKVVDQDGDILLDRTDTGTEVFTETTTSLLTSAMEDVMTEGTGVKANFEGMSLAGKSGTTTGRKDLWFVGYSPYYVCGVWCGLDEADEQGKSDTAKLLWRGVMERAHEGKSDPGFTSSKGLKTCVICTKCGKKAVSGLCDSTLQGNMTKKELFVKGSEPTEDCQCHVAVKICQASGMQANSYCPKGQIQTNVYLKSGTEGTADEAFVIPSDLKNDLCTDHEKWWQQFFGESGNDDSQTENPEDHQNEPDPKPEQSNDPSDQDQEHTNPEEEEENIWDWIQGLF
ncbi:MAG: transglycosylase domain-containing protein, partial [Clostridiales bacterium]|nr:transglycosylase domain-containing protein [Clostridiales bacterium]